MDNDSNILIFALEKIKKIVGASCSSLVFPKATFDFCFGKIGVC
jgi:hypothetical protein